MINTENRRSRRAPLLRRLKDSELNLFPDELALSHFTIRLPGVKVHPGWQVRQLQGLSGCRLQYLMVYRLPCHIDQPEYALPFYRRHIDQRDLSVKRVGVYTDLLALTGSLRYFLRHKVD